MKKIIIILIATIASLNFIACEEEANPGDFLTNEDLEELLGTEIPDDDELGFLDPPVFIGEIGGEAFEAEFQLGTITNGTLVIKFISTTGNELVLSIDNPANDTFTAGRGSVNPFKAQYTIGDGDATYSTFVGLGQEESTGTLGLNDFTGSEVSGNFDFIAFNTDGSNSTITAIRGVFSNVLIN